MIIVLLCLLVLSPSVVDAQCTCEGSRQTLVDFFTALGGANWKQTWPVTDASSSVCNFYGVTCTSGDITDIDLDRNWLRGTLPASLSALTRLKSFSVVYNGVMGTMPAAWGSAFSSLTSLNLPIPPNLGNWGSTMTSLDVSSNLLTGSLPHELGNLNGLSQAYFYSNLFSGTLPSTFGSWTRMRYFSFYNNQFSGSIPSEFSAMTQMVNFDMDNNKLSGTIPASLDAWTNIQTFSATANNLQGSLSFRFSAWTSLHSFYVNQNPQLSGQIPHEFTSWTQIQYFRASDCSFSGTLPDELSSWTRIYTFDMQNNSVLGTLPSSFSSWRRATTIDLSANSLTGTLPAEWVGLREVVYIGLMSNSIEGTLPSSWSGLYNVTTLLLAGNSLSGDLPSSWGSLRLASLVLQQNENLNGIIPSSWSRIFIYSPSVFTLCNSALCAASPGNNAGVTNFMCFPPSSLKSFSYENAFTYYPPSGTTYTSRHLFRARLPQHQQLRLRLPPAHRRLPHRRPRPPQTATGSARWRS